jgi:hypothetical protein
MPKHATQNQLEQKILCLFFKQKVAKPDAKPSFGNHVLLSEFVIMQRCHFIHPNDAVINRLSLIDLL